MKKFVDWLKSPKSDFVLLIIALILLNLVSAKTFFRLDLTSPRSYSLSKSSKQLVKTLEEPLSIKVFFTDNLPYPYNSTEQYLRDILVEYKGAANKNFSYEFFDMDKDENVELARQYRIRQQQIQEVKDNEVGFKNVYMGLAILSGDSVEIIDGIKDSGGLEYKITTKISNMINKTSSLSGISGKVKLTLYLSENLRDFGISGFNSVKQIVADCTENVNKKNLNKIRFEVSDPSPSEIDFISEKYGLDAISWENPDAKNAESKTGRGLIACVIEYGDNFRVLPVRLSRHIFGGYVVAGLDDLETVISENLASLVCRSDKIGYLSGFGCNDLVDSRGGQSVFVNLIDDKYEFVELDLTQEEIPSSINQIVINGAKQKITEEVFYKLDQFLMKGGNLTVFADTFEEVTAQSQYSLPTYKEIDSGLAEFLLKYGIQIEKNVVLDTNCYKSMEAGYGEVPFYYAPVLDSNSLDQKNAISKNLAYVLMFQNSSLNFVSSENATHATVIAKSSAKSWEMKDNIILHPLYITKPSEDTMKQYNLALLVEGKFTSQYDDAFSSNDANDSAPRTTAIKSGTSTHLARGIQNGKIFVIASSVVTTQVLLDEEASSPIAIFVRNALDYMNGNADLCTMRTKGLSLNTLNVKSVAEIRAAKIVNEYVVPLLVIIAGIIVWRCRVKHRKQILKKYSLAKKDERESLASSDKKLENDENEVEK